jgi:hypothetical protein
MANNSASYNIASIAVTGLSLLVSAPLFARRKLRFSDVLLLMISQFLSFIRFILIALGFGELNQPTIEVHVISRTYMALFLIFLVLSIFAVIDRYVLIMYVADKSKFVLGIRIYTIIAYLFAAGFSLLVNHPGDDLSNKTKETIKIVNTLAVGHLSIWSAGLELVLTARMIKHIVPPKLHGKPQFRRLWICFIALFIMDILVIVLQMANYRASFANLSLLEALTVSLFPGIHVMISYQLLDWLKEELVKKRRSDENSTKGSAPSPSVFGPVKAGQSSTNYTSVATETASTISI